MLALTFLCILAAVCVSAGLVVYTAWHHDLKNGLFALAFAVLSARATLSWFLWRESDQPSSATYQQDREGRKAAPIGHSRGGKTALPSGATW
ncbi:MAG: hypothetical protein ICV57_01960 [Rubrobacter sp.]|nr:hypothetical protein [Rubrobacter sp.]